MRKQIWLVLFIAITLLCLQLADAHLPKPMPFSLEVSKNTTFLWKQQNVINVQGGTNFQYIYSGVGQCRKYGYSGSYFKLDFYNQGQHVKEVFGLGVAKARGSHPISLSDGLDCVPGTQPPVCTLKAPVTTWPATLDLQNVLADTLVYNSTCGFNDCGCPGAYFYYGRIEAHKKIQTIDLPVEIKINSQATEIGKLLDLLPNADLSITPQNQLGAQQKLAENIVLKPSRKDVLVWFGDGKDAANPAKGSKTTIAPDKQIIYACSDIDNNGICDADDAAAANCDVFGTEDWYKTACCTATMLKTQGCQLVQSVNAYCGQNSQGQPEFANPTEVGEIHDFSSCSNRPMQIVFDENAVKHECNSNAGWDFIAVKNHEYYCDKQLQQIFECGANESYSETNTVMTGKNITINGKTNYCVERPAIFSTNLDYATNNSCLSTGDPADDGSHTGQVWTGSRCCSEADDLVQGNEYYGEDYSKNPPVGTQNLGGCWNSTYIKTGQYAPSITNNTQQDKSIINYNGTFYGCEVSNPQLLSMYDTDYHPDPRAPAVKTQ